MRAAYPHIAERIFGRAHPVEPNAFHAIVRSPVARRILGGKGDETAAGKGTKIAKARHARLAAIVQADRVTLPGDVGEYAVTSNGVAIVAVAGILSQRFDWLSALCGWTTYEGLAATFEAMLADYRVRAILMDVDSPGGEASGMLDVADAIIAAGEIKPVWAVANNFAASAAYALAGSAQRLFVPRLGQVGSIGAMMIHGDESAYDAATGVNFTAVYSGARKIDGWDHAPLSEPARAAWQAGVDHCRDEFAALVGRQGRMSIEDAIATEAATYYDRAAVDAKLADDVGTFDDALSQLTELVAQNRGAATMAATTPTKPATTTAAAPVATPAAPVATVEQPAASVVEPSAPVAAAPTGAPLSPTAPATVTAASGYGVEAVLETLDLCIIAGTPLRDARALIAAKTPMAMVREKLTSEAASRADALVTVAQPAQPAAANSGWDDAVAKVNSQHGVAARK